MIYVEEKGFDRQIELLSFLSKEESSYICAWLYPESNATKVATQVIEQSNLEPVTSYESGIKPSHTSLVQCSEKTLKEFVIAKHAITKNCDSLAIYQLNSLSWSVATVGHEGMCLVRNEAHLEKIILAGFTASIEAPSWW